jgi:hypothetical protein
LGFFPALSALISKYLSMTEAKKQQLQMKIILAKNRIR